MTVDAFKKTNNSSTSDNSIKHSIVSLNSTSTHPTSMSGTSHSPEKHTSHGKSMVIVHQISKNDDTMSFSDSDNELFLTPPASPSSSTGNEESPKALKHKVSSPSLASISSSLSESFRSKSHSRASSTTSTISSTSSKSFHKRGSSSVSSTSSVVISSPIIFSAQSLDSALQQGIKETLTEDITRISAAPPRPAPAPPVLTHKRQFSLEKIPPRSPTQPTTNFQPINKSPLQIASTISEKNEKSALQNTASLTKSDDSGSHSSILSKKTTEFNNITSSTNLKAYNSLPNQIQQQQSSDAIKTTNAEVTGLVNRLSPQSPSKLSPTGEHVSFFSSKETLPLDFSSPVTPVSPQNLPTVSSASPLLRSLSSFNTSRYEDFAHLTYLDISASESTLNFLSATGRLPRWIQKCTSLQYLVGCKLNLTVIEEWVSQCLIQLRVLRLNDNQISTWPDHLAQLLPYDLLTVVDLEGNPCFTNFCDRCTQFRLDYAKSIDQSSREASKKFLSSRIEFQPAFGLKKKQGSISKKSHHRRISVPAITNTSPPPVSSPTSSASPSTLSSSSLISDSSFDSTSPSMDLNFDSLKKKPSTGFFGRRHKKSYSAQLQNTISKLSNLSTTSIETAIGSTTSLSDTFINESPMDKKSENATEVGKHEDSNTTEATLNSPTEANNPIQGPSGNTSNLYFDDDSDDEALTSLEPVINTKFIGRETLSSPLIQELTPNVNSQTSSSVFSAESRQISWASKQRASAMFLVSDVPENMSNLLSSQLGPDTWAQKRIEPSEVEKSKVVLNLLRDIWEMSTNSILYHVPDLTAEALAAATARRNSAAHDAKSDPVFCRVSPISSIADSKQHSNNVSSSSGVSQSHLTFAGRNLGHGRANSADVIPQYSSPSNTEINSPKLHPKTSNKEIAKLLLNMIEEEKTFVKRVNELITIYVKSKKCPPKAAKIFNDIEPIYQLHSETLYPGLQKSYEVFLAHKDPKLERLSSLILAHINELRIYIRYEVSLDESLRLANFWKRLIGGDSSQNMVSYGANVPHLANYTHPDAIIAEWIKNCHRHKSHSLGSITDYLQLPTYHFEKYRDFLKAISFFSPGLCGAHDQLELINKAIEEEKPLAAEARRYDEFDQVYDFSSQLPARIPPFPERRYLGDAVILLRSEVFLELPSKHSKADCIHYMTLDAPHCNIVKYGSKESSFSRTKPIFEMEPKNCTEESFTVNSVTNNCNNSILNGLCRANPVPKVVQKQTIKSKFNLALHRIIVFDDVIVFTDEDKKCINRVVPRSKITVTLPWKYPVREGAEALPTGDQISYKSKSSANSVYNQNRYSISSTAFGGMNLQSSAPSAPGHHKGSGNSGSLRMMFHDDPKIWYCTLRSFNSERKLKSKEPRSRLVELFTIS